MDQAEFTRLVRDGLNHLYEDAYLQQHALAAALAGLPAHGAAGPTLHRMLLEAIENMRPSPRLPLTATRWQQFLVLSHRYIDDMSPAEVAEALSISPRQFRRLQAEAVDALALALWERYQHLQAATPSETGSGSLVDAEVGRLGAARPADATPLAATLEGVMNTLARLAQGRSVSLTIQMAPDLPPVAVDRVVLRQILLSVLAQAIDQGAHGALAVTASRAGSQIELRIEHRGEPAPDPVARPDDDRLATANHLVETHGGRLTASRDQRTMTLALPIGRPPTLLVVDDDPNVARLFQRYLAEGAFQVVGATNIEEALRLAQELKPQAITLDVMMPSQDGWEVLQGLKALPATAGIPVIICSVLRERELALSLGASDLIAKPVSREQLLTALARWAPGPRDA